MSWSIAVIHNTIIIPEEHRALLMRALIIAAPQAFWQFDGVRDAAQYLDGLPAEKHNALITSLVNSNLPDGEIYFDPDHREHMDFITQNDAACAAIAQTGASGSIVFGSLEGDNKGQFWGVQFSDGEYVRIKATVADIVFDEVGPPSTTFGP